jgi:hypothetical protein
VCRGNDIQVRKVNQRKGKNARQREQHHQHKAFKEICAFNKAPKSTPPAQKATPTRKPQGCLTPQFLVPDQSDLLQIVHRAVE